MHWWKKSDSESTSVDTIVTKTEPINTGQSEPANFGVAPYNKY